MRDTDGGGGTSECLLEHPELGIGHGKECCCICANQLIANVCNCFDVWPESIMVGKPHKLNDKHFSIGYACLAFASDGIAEIQKEKHGGCECFRGRSEGGQP